MLQLPRYTPPLKNTKKISIIFSNLVVLSLLLMFFLTTLIRSVDLDVERLNLLALLRAEISKRSIITDTYILYRDKSIVSQLDASNQRMTRLLEQAKGVFISPEDRPLIEKIAEGDEKLRQADVILFAPATAAPEEQEAFRVALETRGAMLTAGSDLSTVFRSHITALLKKTAVGVALALTLLVFMSFLNLTWIRRIVGKLSDKNAELDSANAQIKREQKVAEEINEKLLAQTDQMKKSEEKLKEKIFELERFNKLTVDRELKMIALKKELVDAHKNI